MNFQKVQRKNRKAISPVLATVILIAITLIAAVAIAGFVFGLFGSFTTSATLAVSSSQVTCTDVVSGVATDQHCIVNVTDSGATAGSVTGAGPTSGSVTMSIVGTVPIAIPGNSAGTPITVDVMGGNSGQSVQGWLTTNGANLNFVAILQ
jgi:archaeal type IV pilus assembly protein PilA